MIPPDRWAVGNRPSLLNSTRTLTSYPSLLAFEDHRSLLANAMIAGGTAPIFAAPGHGCYEADCELVERIRLGKIEVQDASLPICESTSDRVLDW